MSRPAARHSCSCYLLLLLLFRLLMHFAVHERLPIDRRHIEWVIASAREWERERKGALSASKTINNSIKLDNDEAASVCT